MLQCQLSPNINLFWNKLGGDFITYNKKNKTRQRTLSTNQHCILPEKSSFWHLICLNLITPSFLEESRYRHKNVSHLVKATQLINGGTISQSFWYLALAFLQKCMLTNPVKCMLTLPPLIWLVMGIFHFKIKVNQVFLSHLQYTQEPC